MDSSDLRYLFENEDGSFDIDLNADYYGEVDFQMQYAVSKATVSTGCTPISKHWVTMPHKPDSKWKWFMKADTMTTLHESARTKKDIQYNHFHILILY